MKKFLKILLKLLLWLVSILAVLYLITLSYCSYEVGYKPYRGIEFDKKIWSGESKLKIDQSGKSSSSEMFPSVYGTNVQCKMYHDIVTNVLKKGIHISEVEDLLGKKENEILIYCIDEKTKCITYSLGTCYASSLTISHGSLNICFDKNPSESNWPVTLDSKKGEKIKLFFKHYIENAQDYPNQSGFIKHTSRINEAGYKAAKEYSESNRMSADAYIGGIDDCITIQQELHKIAGLPGDFADRYTEQDLKHMDSLAAKNMQFRYGIKGETVTVTTTMFESKEALASRFNVPVDNVKFIIDDMFTGISRYKILPFGEGDK